MPDCLPDYADPEPTARDWFEGLAGRLFDHTAAALILALMLLSPLLATAAPQAKRPAPKADEVVGEYRVGSKDGPIVAVPRQGEPDLEVWLVFGPGAGNVEAFARTLKPGDRVRVAGRLAHGGEWKYLIVSDLTKDE